MEWKEAWTSRATVLDEGAGEGEPLLGVGTGKGNAVRGWKRNPASELDTV